MVEEVEVEEIPFEERVQAAIDRMPDLRPGKALDPRTKGLAQVHLARLGGYLDQVQSESDGVEEQDLLDQADLLDNLYAASDSALDLLLLLAKKPKDIRSWANSLESDEYPMVLIQAAAAQMELLGK